jgi:hypothetical protein
MSRRMVLRYLMDPTDLIFQTDRILLMVRMDRILQIHQILPKDQILPTDPTDLKDLICCSRQQDLTVLRDLRDQILQRDRFFL